jgi:hypothetical protein
MRTIIPSLLILALLPSAVYADNYVVASFGVSEPAIRGYADDTTLKIGYGVKKSDHYAFEISYLSLGEFGAGMDVLEEISNEVGEPVSSSAIEITGVDLSMLSILSLGNAGFVHFKLGLYLWDAEYTAHSPILGNSSFSKDGEDLSFGAGLNLILSDQISLEIARDQYQAVDGDVSLLNAGIKIGF